MVFVSIGKRSLERTLRLLFSIELEFSENLIDVICSRFFFGLWVVGSWCFLCIFLLLVFVSGGQWFSESSPWPLFYSIESRWARILVECIWSGVEQDFWILGDEGDVFFAFCYFWHVCGSWFWESIPWWMLVDLKFVSSISESLFNLMWSRIFGSCAARVVFSLPVVFSAICVYGSIVSSIHCHVDMVVACDHVDRRFPLHRLCSQWTVSMRTT